MMICRNISLRSATTTGLFAFLILFVISCKENDSTSSDGTHTISGKVAFIGTVNSVSGATVKCGGQSATSAADGSYELRGVPAGTHEITAEGPNCKPYSATLEIKSNTIHYIYVQFHGTTISGYVSNFLDGPVNGATVRIGSLSDVTDQGGKYVINDAPMKSDSIIITHSQYHSFRGFFSPTGPETRIDASMLRDSVFIGRLTAEQYVDEAMPGSTFLQSWLLVSPNATAGNVLFLRKNIYLNFDFPASMKDSRVTMLGGSLELCVVGARGAIVTEVFTVASPWYPSSLTYDHQPTIGASLGYFTQPEVSGPQYVTILSADVLQQLLSEYRQNGHINGVMIQARPSIITSRSYYSSRSAINPPRLSFKVRF